MQQKKTPIIEHWIHSITDRYVIIISSFTQVWHRTQCLFLPCSAMKETIVCTGFSFVSLSLFKSLLLQTSTFIKFFLLFLSFSQSHQNNSVRRNRKRKRRISSIHGQVIMETQAFILRNSDLFYLFLFLKFHSRFSSHRFIYWTIRELCHGSSSSFYTPSDFFLPCFYLASLDYSTKFE